MAREEADERAQLESAKNKEHESCQNGANGVGCYNCGQDNIRFRCPGMCHDGVGHLVKEWDHLNLDDFQSSSFVPWADFTYHFGANSPFEYTATP